MIRQEALRIAAESFRNMVLVALDLFWFGIDTERRIRRHVRCDESAHAFFSQKKSKMAVAAHFGNWELMGQAFSLLYEPAYSVAAPLRNSFVDRLVCRMRAVTGQTIIPQKGAIRALLRLLHSGHTVALLPDQNTLPVDGGVFVDFFGLPVPVSKALAGLYVKERPDLAFVYALSDGKGDYAISARPLDARWRECESIPEVTQAIVRLVEDAIREHPTRWLWMYKRWKFIPEKRAQDGYPWYARPIEP
jgi:KDO2-lipid IV(A) lauroyltransferase